LISGRPLITAAITATVTTAITSFPILCTVLSPCSVFVQDFLHRGYRVRQGRLDRVR
jgi:hypothetical protein